MNIIINIVIFIMLSLIGYMIIYSFFKFLKIDEYVIRKKYWWEKPCDHGKLVDCDYCELGFD